jgi:hypothetical protein
MRLKMQARQLWDTVEYGDLPYHDDRRALEAIIAGVPQEMQVSLADKHNAKDAWDSIAAARIASTASAAPRCNDCAKSGRTSPSTRGSTSRTSPSASPH